MLWIVIVFTVNIMYVSAAPKLRNECYVPELGKAILIGELGYGSIAGCFEYACSKNGYEINGCPLFMSDSDCLIGYISEDLSKPYPECCPKQICKML